MIKRVILILVGAALVGQCLDAQVDATSNPSGPLEQPVDQVEQVGPPGNGVYAITENAAHWRRWAKTTQVEGEMGVGVFQTVTVTNAYIELGTGLNKLDAAGHWIAASDEIELFQGAAVARQTQHQIIFAANVTDQNGTIDVFMPNGKRLRSRVVGLAYTDDTGRSVFVAELKDSIGQLLDNNQILYPDAFDSDLIKGELLYTTTIGTFEQDVILREQLPPPADLHLDPKSTHLEIWSEFLEFPEPLLEDSAVERLSQTRDVDQQVDFHAMRIVRGRAFRYGNPEGEQGLPISKEWQTIAGRSFLIESVPYLELSGLIGDALPEPCKLRSA